MSDDLISRKALYETMNSQEEEISLIDALATIEEAPTAYDVDKVVEQLKSHNNSEKMATSKIFDGKHRYYRAVSVTKAIKIIKAGGIDDN